MKPIVRARSGNTKAVRPTRQRANVIDPYLLEDLCFRSAEKSSVVDIPKPGRGTIESLRLKSQTLFSEGVNLRLW